MKLHRVDYGTPHPVEVEAENPTYPNEDNDGLTIYENTHFADREKAWAYLLREVQAGAALRLRCLKQAERDMEKARTEFIDAARIAVETSEAWKDEQRGRNP